MSKSKCSIERWNFGTDEVKLPIQVDQRKSIDSDLNPSSTSVPQLRSTVQMQIGLYLHKWYFIFKHSATSILNLHTMAPSKRQKCIKRKSKLSDPCTHGLESFHIFPQLPTEIRFMIYNLALPPRIVTIDVLRCFKLACHNINTYTGHKYPGPTPAERFDRAQRREDEPVAAFERLYARSKTVALFAVSRESRESVLKHYKFEFDSCPEHMKVRDGKYFLELPPYCPSSEVQCDLFQRASC